MACNKQFYSVACGRTQGIFLQWSAAKAQVDKYPGATHKGFETLEDAIDFMLAHSYTTIEDIDVYTMQDSEPTPLAVFKSHIQACPDSSGKEMEISHSPEDHQGAEDLHDSILLSGSYLSDSDELNQTFCAPDNEPNSLEISPASDAEPSRHQPVSPVLRSDPAELQRPEISDSEPSCMQKSQSTDSPTELPKCPSCGEPAVNRTIRCSDCKSLIHYDCTDLPRYQLFLPTVRAMHQNHRELSI